MTTVLMIDHAPAVSGAQISALRLVGGGGVEPAECAVVCPPGGLAERFGPAGLGVRVYRAPLDRLRDPVRRPHLLPKNAAYLVLAAKTAIRAAREVQARIVYANSPRVVPVALLAARAARAKVVTHIHDIRPQSLRDTLLWFSSEVIVANSNASAERFYRFNRSGEKLRIIPYGIPTEEFANDGPDLRAELGVGPRQPVVGIIGQLARWKGQHIFLEAAAQVRPTLPDTHFLVVGDELFSDGTYKPSLLRQVTQLGLETAVTFLGFRSDVATVMRSLDVLVHASVEPEPFGLVIVEGMSAGLPVVATRGGGVVDIIQDGRTGRLVRMGDADEMAAAITELLLDREAARSMGQAARREAVARFDLRIQRAAMSSLFAELAARR